MNRHPSPSHWRRLWGAICGAALLAILAGTCGVLVAGPDGVTSGAFVGGTLGFLGGYASPHLATAVVDFVLSLFPSD